MMDHETINAAESPYKEEQFAVSTPQASLPKGGGAIQGIGEKFGANPATGSGSISVPIAASSGRAGSGPKLSLNYDSGSGNGPFGFGWKHALPAITRKTDKGLPRYLDAEDSDEFLLSGAEDLVPVLVEVAGEWQREHRERQLHGVSYHVEAYRPRTEGLFARIERWSNIADPTDSFWRSISRDNITTWYGRTKNSRITDPADAARIYRWLICESHDDKGNLTLYDYKSEDSEGIDLTLAHERNRTAVSRSNQRYLKRIRYGNTVPYFPEVSSSEPGALPEQCLFELVFDYGDHDPAQPTPQESLSWPVRPDPFSTYRPGFELRTYRLCQRILMFHRFSELGDAPCLVRSTDFTYEHETDPGDSHSPEFSFLQSVTQTGYRRRTDGTYVHKAMPPLEFEYSRAKAQEDIRELTADSLENLPIGLDGTRFRWVDLDGEGISGILSEQGGDWLYKPNLGPSEQTPLSDSEPGPHLGPARRVAREPSSASMNSGRARLMDLAGDGQLDVVELDRPQPGFYERTDNADWAPWKAFELLPNVDWSDPHLRLVDLTGDGLADILITEQDAFCWHPALGEAGFDSSRRVRKLLDEEQGPRVVLGDATQSVHLADFSGDGLSDVVRIRNGEICYWPNLGYGRFGPKVTMDNGPRFDRAEAFDPARIRLADIDGSGTTDIIYLGHGRVNLFFNQSGNRWSEPQQLASFPLVDDLASVQVADLLGNGTACLIWSSSLQRNARRPLRYVDLMGGQKPHLLIGSSNNLGAETRVHYVPSTHFYLADKRAGKPWVTRLPFPVHVVERVETLDHLSGNRFVTRHAYHHGYFDPVEREFRGFGMVEQWDTEELATLTADNATLDATNLDAASHVPPVHTKTWFHTGAYLGRKHISDFFAGLLDANDTGEYYRETGLTDAQARTLLLSDTPLPEGLTLEEEREACRALRGRMLRQEVYALDGTDKASHPYTVTEQNFGIRRLQPKADNAHAVFLTHARESLAYHYERNPADPRISHALTLEVDDYGNTLKSVAIGYGRRLPDTALSIEDQQKQSQLLATLTESDYTNPVELDDTHRTSLPCEVRNYELTGLEPSADKKRVAFDDCLAAADTAKPLNYEQEPDGTQPQKRLIEQLRTRYRPDDLGAAQGDPLALLPLGLLESMALPGESYKLALTADLVSQTFAGRVSDAMLETEGRYVHSEGDGDWWIPSGRVFLSPTTTDSPAAELAHARAHFYLPHRFRDPFHSEQSPTESVVSYDGYDLLLQETRDALDNRVTVGERDAAGTLAVNGNDYRVLQPALVMDPNRNRVAAAYDTLGMVVGTAVMGKPEEDLGDTLDGFEPDLNDADIAAHLAAPLDDPHSILQGATTRLVYDLFAYQHSKNDPSPRPPVAYSLVRETHVSDLDEGRLGRVQHAFSYSDGFGREIQKKARVEPGPLQPGGPDVPARWVGSGWTVFNNKGKPIRQYEPFFSDTHRYEREVVVGVSPILFYDPGGRVVGTLHPNHTWQKVRFDAWRQESWDVSDTVLTVDPAADPDAGAYFDRLPETDYLPTWYAERIDGALGSREQQAAEKSAVYDKTPTVTHLDSLGRSFLSVAHNRLKRPSADPGAAPEEDLYKTRIVYDIEGNQHAVIDAKGRAVMQYEYDLLGTPIHSVSMDAGHRWMLNDIVGQPIRAWDGRGHAFRIEYDALHRPIHRYVYGRDSDESDSRVLGQEIQFERIEYGEGQPDDLTLNLRARVFRSNDGAGIVTNEQFDFKGNPLSATRQLASDYKALPDWTGSVALETEVFRTTTAYDALNRSVSQVTPDNSETRRSYNEAGLLEIIEANLRGEQRNQVPIWTRFVDDIDYNAKGQRERIRYGNGVVTTYDYDPVTLRLTRLKTTRSTDGDLQNLSYTYDAAGNITHIRDDAQQTHFFANTKIEPHCDYTYDAINKLIVATGREHFGQMSQVDHNDPQLQLLPHPNNGEAMRRYQEEYFYDAVGNIEKMIHQANGSLPGSWTRYYAYAADSNRLLATSLPGDDPRGPYTAQYPHNPHGSMTTMPHLAEMRWDFNEQMRGVDLDGGGEAFYVYDASGQRVRKVWEKSENLIEERIYLNGFEVFRNRNERGVISLERETLHVVSNHRIALVETRSVDLVGDDPAPEQLIRYQLGNHLNSASLEVDGHAQLVSYEEYMPYGSTAYHATRSQTETPKRYRYTGMERDEESHLSYHGARLYAPWLGRWCSADPSGIVDGPNMYAYVRGNPVSAVDTNGNVFLLPWLLSSTAHAPTAPEVTDSDRVMERVRSETDLWRLPSGRLPTDRELVADDLPVRDWVMEDGSTVESYAPTAMANRVPGFEASVAVSLPGGLAAHAVAPGPEDLAVARAIGSVARHVSRASRGPATRTLAKPETVPSNPIGGRSSTSSRTLENPLPRQFEDARRPGLQPSVQATTDNVNRALGFSKISEHPEYNRIWLQVIEEAIASTRARTADGAPSYNALQKFIIAVEDKGGDYARVDAKLRNAAWKQIRGNFANRVESELGKEAREALGPIHHELRKADYPEHTFDPDYLWPTGSIEDHNFAHDVFSGGKGTDEYRTIFTP